MLNKIKRSKSLSVLILASFIFSSSGCAMLKPDQYERHGYHGTAQVKEGRRVLPIDWLGNLFGVFEKLIIWNWKMERHNITDGTEQAANAYIEANKEVLGDVALQLNRYAPQDSWKRLVRNHRVKWPYRLFLGSIFELIGTLLPGRIFGADHYDPFTHTIHLYSDIPAVALHELGHAKDFGQRRYRGSYALFRIVPFADLYQEYKATDNAFKYVRENQMYEQEIENYKVLYPAYGSYVGGYLGLFSLVGIIAGHIWGRSEAHDLEEYLDRNPQLKKAA